MSEDRVSGVGEVASGHEQGWGFQGLKTGERAFVRIGVSGSEN
jgi:hypothetical protein